MMHLERLEGALTALQTSFYNGKVDYDGLKKNIEFQIACGVNLVPCGTTGESPTLSTAEHNKVIAVTAKQAAGRAIVVAGAGSNSTKEAMSFVKHAKESGCEAVLLVDSYYNGPSSQQLRTEYYSPIAKAFPGIAIIPYIIPGRTGAKLEPQDLAILHEMYGNIIGVKEATGDFKNMALVRELIGNKFSILSGDDDKTSEMMRRWDIRANGVVSVVSNVAPLAVKNLTTALRNNRHKEAEALGKALEPLFKIVTVITEEDYGRFTGVPNKWKNPGPIKTLMNGLGMPAGDLRQPLGKLSPKAVAIVRDAAITVYQNNREVLLPIQDFYGINLEERLDKLKYWN